MLFQDWKKKTELEKISVILKTCHVSTVSTEIIALKKKIHRYKC